MSNLPLKALPWSRALSAKSAFHLYTVRKDSENEDKFVVLYCRRHETAKLKKATGFPTVELAKTWAWNHYNEKMQPYVKPMPTWIDASERLPEEDGLYLAHYPDQPYKQQIVFFSSNIDKFNLFHELITHWMPIPEFSTMQNLHKGGGCE